MRVKSVERSVIERLKSESNASAAAIFLCINAIVNYVIWYVGKLLETYIV